MDDGSYVVIETVDEYSYILNARKVTIGRGERFFQLDRPNQRWVLACRPSGDRQKLLLPARIISPISSDSISFPSANLSNHSSFTSPDSAVRTTDTLFDMSQLTSSTDIPTPQPRTRIHTNSSVISCPVAIVRVRPNMEYPVTTDSSAPHCSSPLAVTNTLSEPVQETAVVSGTSEAGVTPKPRSESNTPESLTIETQENACAAETSTAAPVRWRRQINDGLEVFVNPQTDEKWAPAVDHTGKTYYYEISTRQSVWELQDLETTNGPSVEADEGLTDVSLNTNGTRSVSSMNAYLTASSTSGTGRLDQARTQDDIMGELDNWSSSDNDSYSLSPPANLTTNQNGSAKQNTSNNPKKPKVADRSGKSANTVRLARLSTLSLSGNRAAASGSKASLSREEEMSSQADLSDGRFNLRHIGKEHISGPEQNKLTNFERRGMVSRTKLVEQGRRVSKKWSEALMVLSGPWLFLYRDTKAATPKASCPYGKPEVRFHAQQLVVTDATGEDTSRKCVLKLEVEAPESSKTAYLVQLPENVLDSWKAAFRYAKEILNDEERLTPQLARSTIRNLPRPPSKLDTSLVTKMRDFFRTRPSAESLRARGILKNEPVFASTLVQICENEKSEVPRFIACAVRAIEARGLDHLGLYRISANASEVQKLRCCVNQYNYSLNSEKWSLDVLAGGLKLFFRELKEPLFTFELFPKLKRLFASKVDEANTLTSMQEMISSMPGPHIATARVLFHHLYRVLKHSDANQMHAHKLAIVFGPNLIRSDTEVEHLGILTAVQAPCVDFCLKHIVQLFGPVVPPPVVV